MNLSKPLRDCSKLLCRVFMSLRRFLPKQKSQTFDSVKAKESLGVERIYVINLDRQRDRWRDMQRELALVLDASQTELTELAVRYSAVDVRDFVVFPPKDDEISPFYTLRDQLFVEPQPDALPPRLELDRPIRMSWPEIAVARSHIGVWRQIAAGEQEYALILEDDVWFHRGFARQLDLVWDEIATLREGPDRLDILYLSYEEVRNGAQKTFFSSNVFRPMRGLWYLSGYVLSREGAEKLLQLLPCRGPVDLWINHQFGTLNVVATRRSMISQRRDCDSTNSYSILPSLTKIGVINSEDASLFQIPPLQRPVFAFGPEGTGLSSLAMALSMLGYRRCSDLDELPECEHEKLLGGSSDRVFDAYINIGCLEGKIPELKKRYPQAKFIATAGKFVEPADKYLDRREGIEGSEVILLRANEVNK